MNSVHHRSITLNNKSSNKINMRFNKRRRIEDSEQQDDNKLYYRNNSVNDN